jgi:hypothetical protein
MRWISPLISDGRNKLGGTVYARNASGLYARPLVQPAQPRTVSQQTNRALFGAIIQRWPALTQTQRNGWNTAAESIFITDSLGHKSNPSGQQLFTSRNRNLALADLPGISSYAAQLIALPVPVVSVNTAFIPVSGPFLILLGLDAASNAFFTKMTVQASKPMGPTVNFIGPALYRNIAPPYSKDGAFVFVGPAYQLLFPAATAGQTVGFKVRTVDPASGACSTWGSVLTKFT